MADDKDSKSKVETDIRLGGIFNEVASVTGAKAIADDEETAAEKELRFRVLHENDIDILDAFLASRPDTHLYLRQCLQQGGTEDEGRTYQGTWVGAVESDPDSDKQTILAAAAIFWNGLVILQVPQYASEVLDTLAGAAQRDFTEVWGPTDQVEKTESHLWLRDRPIKSRHDCSYMKLAEDGLKPPAQLSLPGVDTRPPMGEELTMLGDWQAGFREELWGDPRTEESDIESREWVRRMRALRQDIVVTVENKPVAYAAISARFADEINITGVFVPPEQRGKGYAKAAVAGLVRDAQSDGVTRASLTADKTAEAPQAAYRAIGFEHACDFTIVRFHAP